MAGCRNPRAPRSCRRRPRPRRRRRPRPPRPPGSRCLSSRPRAMHSSCCYRNGRRREGAWSCPRASPGSFSSCSGRSTATCSALPTPKVRDRSPRGAGDVSTFFPQAHSPRPSVSSFRLFACLSTLFLRRCLLVCLCLFIPLHPSLSLFVIVPLSVSLCLFVPPASLFLSTSCVSVYLSLCLFVSPRISPSLPRPIFYLFFLVPLSLSLCLCLTTTPSLSKHCPSAPRTFSGLSQGHDSPLTPAWLVWSGRQGTDSCSSNLPWG